MKTRNIWTLMLTCMVAMSFTGLREGGKTVRVIPDPGLPADPADNIIYTPTFRAAWTMLKEDIVKSDVRLQKPVDFVDNLNNNPYRSTDDPDWIALSGFVENGIIDRIDSQLNARFGVAQSGLMKYSREKDAIICYSRFRKYVSFKMPFETLKWKFTMGGQSAQVACFGVTRSGGDHKAEMRQQACFYDYRNPDDFIVKLTGKDPDREIILAKTEFQGSVREMITIVNDRIRQTYPEEISELDELIIPKIKLAVNHTYKELIGKFLANTGFRDYFFVEAGQDVSFSLDESGARAEATGTIVKMKGPVPRIYAIDKPFLLILGRPGSPEPDLVLWIANTEFLVPSE